MKRFITGAICIIVALCLTVGVAMAGETGNRKLDAYYTLALNGINAAEYDDALKYLDKCLEYCDANNYADICADVYLKKGSIYTMQKAYDRALVALDTALTIDPALSEVDLVRSQIFSENGLYAEAIEALQRYMEASGDGSMVYALADLYRQNGDDETANALVNEYENALAEARAHYETGTAMMNAGDFAGAADAFIACSEDGVYGPSACYSAGVCFVNTGDYSAAQTYLEKALMAGVTIDGIYYNCGICRMAQEDFGNAITFFTASLAVESFKNDAAYNRAVCKLNLKDYAGAIEDFGTYIDGAKDKGDQAADEDYAKAYFFRGLCALLSGDYTAAAKDYSQCVELDYEPVLCKVNRALCYTQTGDYAEVVADSTDAINAGESVAECSYYRAVAYANLGRYDEAIADFTRCIELEYDVQNMYYQRGQIYKTKGDRQHYLEDLERSVA